MIDQIIGFLKSDDMEMVQLGARLLESQVPKRQWHKILTDCSRDVAEEERRAKREQEDIDKKIRGDFLWSIPITAIFPKWNFEIVNHERKIIIKTSHMYDPGLWTQLSTKSRQVGQNYKVITGKGGLKMLEGAMKNFHLPPKQIRNRIKHK